MLAACTIASNNYLAFARVFAESYRRHHPGAEIFVCVVDRPHPAIDYRSLPFRVVFAHELDIASFGSFAFRYDVLELNTAVKPSLLLHLRDRIGLDRVAYFDPDIEIHDRLAEVESALDRAPVALTPHILQPLDNVLRPSERQIRMTGIFNLGFVAMRLDRSTAAFLDWWRDRLERFCLVDPWHGLFVDQSWMDFAPAFFDEVAILREPRLNVAYWNLAKRPLRRTPTGWRIGERALGFFHYSGIDLDDVETVSRHQNRIRSGERPELAELFAGYRRALLDAGHEGLRAIPYGYAEFDDGAGPVPKLLRRLLLRVDPHGRRWRDPFAVAGEDSYLGWLTEPIACYHGMINRALLSAWESRQDLIERFPRPCHEHLQGYVDWLVRDGGLEQVGLDARFARGLQMHGPEWLVQRTFAQEPHRAHRREQIPELPDWLSGIDLAHPGEWTERLIEPYPGDPGRAARLPRLAMALWESDGALQARFPDPLRADRRRFLLWYVWEGALERGLAAELVLPVAEKLGWRDRLHLAWRGLGADPATPSTPAPPARRIESSAVETPPPASAPPAASTAEAAPGSRPAPRRTPLGERAGVNVLAQFQSGGRDAQLARGSLLALAGCERPATPVDLDVDPWGASQEGLIQLPEGAPQPILLAHIGIERAPWMLGRLPTAATVGGARVLYLAWDFAAFPSSQSAWLHHFDEVWVPCEAARVALAAVADLPVRRVEPCLPMPAAVSDRAAWGLPEGRRLLLARFDAEDPLQRDDPWTLLAALRALVEGGMESSRFELVLCAPGLRRLANVASPAGQLANALAEASAGLPVRILDRALSGAEEDSLLASCDAYASLARADGVGWHALRALAAGRPVVATAVGALAELLDESTGYPVAWRPVALARNAGFLGGAARWAEPEPGSAVAALRALLEGGAAAAVRAAAGRELVRTRYAEGAAARRLDAELARLAREHNQRGQSPSPG